MTLYQATPNGRVALSKEEEAEFIARKEAMAAEFPTRKAAYVREQRNDLLAASDWTQANDSPLSNDKKIEWATYRTALRDLPSSSDWPDVTFPEEPS